MLAQWPWLDSFWMLFWFTCMLGYDLGNFVLWAYSQMSLPSTVFVDTPFWACIPFHCSTAHYKPLAWKNHDYSYLRKFWSFGIVLRMGAQLSVVAHNKCGCARTCCWFLELLICTPKWDFKIYCFSACSLYRKKKEKKKKKRIKKRNKKEFGFEHCVRIEVGSVGVWDYFHDWLRLIPHCSSISLVA